MSALLANKLDAVSRQIADQNPTGNADLDKTLGNIVANAMSTVAGGVVGGAQGAQAAYNVDRFNRQLHPEERKWISQREAAYAKRYGLTEEQAREELTTQAKRQVQNGSAGEWNQRPHEFLKWAHGMLPAEGESGPGYMFYATPDQKAGPSMYAGHYPDGVGLNYPSAEQINSSVSKEQADRNLIGGATIAAVAGGALAVGAPVAAAVGNIGFATIGASTGAGMDAAGQYAQSGTVRPAQSSLAGATGAIAGPIGANTGFVGNILLSGASSVTNTFFNNIYYGESNSTLYAGGVGVLSGVGGYLVGSATTRGLTQVTRPFIYPNLNPKIPALLQGVRNPFPGFGGATAGSIVQGTSSFVPSKEPQK
jgi:filamentous hemagglutinin